MTDSNPTFNIFGDPTKENIRVGYISTDRGFISGVSVCEANDYAKLNPGTIFIHRNREKIEYIDINDVNKLTTDDLLPENVDDCKGIQIDAESECKPRIELFGGAGLGVLANPIVGKDGSIISVDVVEGGFGYEYEPSAMVKDPCGIGEGAKLKVGLVTSVTSELIEYSDEEDFEDYEICDTSNDVGFGRRYDVIGKDIGEWSPSLYLEDGALSFDEEIRKYSEFLLKAPNPWWTTRTEPPLKVTSDGKVTRSKYDVFHWAWGAVPGTNDPIGNLYIKLFGRDPDPRGLKYWRDIMATGKNLSEIEAGMKTFPEWQDVCEGKCKPVMPNKTYLGGQYYEYDKNNFMNSYAISPVPMSNVVPSDFGGQEHYFEWDIDFPHSGDYKFKFQCDNQGSLYVDGEKKGEYKLGSGGAGGNVLSPPETVAVGITTGFHKVRLDIFNGAVMEKVAEQQKLDALATSDEVKFDVQVATMYGASATIEGLDISYEKGYGIGKDVFDSTTKKVEYGKIYDVKITSNNKRTGNLPATNKELQFEGLNPSNNPIKVVNKKQLVLKDNHKDDANATFTIDSGNATFAADGRSVKGTGTVTITLWWNDRRKYGRAINSIKLGSTIWTRKGSNGSETHTLTLGGGVGQLGGENNKAHLRTKGQKVLQMEDIPHDINSGSGGTGNESDLYNDVVIAVDQGRFFDINGLTCKYTLGDRPAETGTTSTENTGKRKTIFNTADYINDANVPLWRTNIVTSKDSGFVNRYGVSPFDTSVIYESSKTGTHTIKWHNVNFPVSGEYDIGIGVDDNVNLKIGSYVNISKEGFSTRGDGQTYTGTSLYRKFIRAGTYTIEADLEQVEGGNLGYAAMVKGAGGNPMTLAINIETAYTEKDVQSNKSWNQNPMGVALAIEAPDPPIPQEPVPIQEGRCPPNPFWSTRFKAKENQWYPFGDHRSKYRYGMSPVKPYGEEDSSGGGQTYSNTWEIDAPYDGYYKLKLSADDSAVVRLDGNEVLRTVKLSTQESHMVGISSGPHEITVEVTNNAQETFDSIDQRVFTTQGWAALGTNVDQALNTNDVDFKVVIATMYGATASIPELDVYFEKEYDKQSVDESFSKKVVFGKVYDVKITSNTKRSGNLPATNKALIIDGDGNLPGHSRLSSSKRIEYDDNARPDGSSFDVNATFTIDSGNGTFAADGKSIIGTGEQTITLWWNDAKKRGRAINSIKIGDTVWKRSGKNGSETHKTVLGGGVGVIGGENNKAELRTKGENVLTMEDIPYDVMGGSGQTGNVEDLYKDVVITANQGRFYDINGDTAKFVVEKETKRVMQGGTGSGTVKDGVVYSGPELFHMQSSHWGSFMNKAGISQNPLIPNTQTVNYSWSDVDFPEDGIYQVKFQNDAHASLYLDGKEIVRGNFDLEAGVSDQDKSNWSGAGKYKKVLVTKGKHTLTVKPSFPSLVSTLFKQPVGYKWHEDPSGFAIEIRKKMSIVRTTADGKPVTKSWKENPVLVSAHLIPPPCPRVVEGKGVVEEIIPIDPGCGYTPPTTPDEETSYDVLLELTNVLIEDPGINYGPDDKVIITGGPGDPVLPPVTPILGPFGSIIDIPVPPGVWAGFTEWPDISVSTSTGIGLIATPVLTPRRTPVQADPDRLIQVTDLVGLKQTGYYDGKPYYGAVFYKDGARYAGWYETAGQLVQIYATLQESIDAMVTTPPSAIQRQGSDIRSNDPRLDIPGTPDNLTY